MDIISLKLLTSWQTGWLEKQNSRGNINNGRASAASKE
jgi:hypothetical protein